MIIVRRLVRPAIVAALAVAALVPVGPASAAINPASYYHVDVVNDYPVPFGGAAGGYISCPAGMKAVASGATSSGLRDWLASGLTTFDGNGAFVTARGITGGHLQMSARCVDAMQVQASTLATKVIRDQQPTYYHTGRATCPPGTIAYGGGGFLSQNGEPLRNGVGVTYASMPDANGTDWIFANAVTLVPGRDELSIATHCLPRSQFGQILTATATDTAPDDNSTLFAGARCPTGYDAYAGGAWWHRAGSSTPDYVGFLGVSNMTADDRGWFARGWAFENGAQLTATVQCMSTVSVVVPDVLGSSKGVAGQRVSAAGLAPRFTGATTTPGAYVDAQTPASGTSVASGSTVTMHLRAEPTCGPNPC